MFSTYMHVGNGTYSFHREPCGQPLSCTENTLIDAYFVILPNVSLPTVSHLPHAFVAVRITNHQLFRRGEDYLYERDYFRSLVGLPDVRGMLRAYGRGGCRSAGLLQEGRG